MKKKKLSCFIASALGKDDVDEIYNNSFDSVLKELHIKPKRVDLIEHNEDIDDKIIELINECDFCIADLTYARPSVYFEAGYFVGLNKSVIYTARSDHFIPKEDDIFGNYKIHFDLQMKNIIRWSSTTKVKTFNNKLKNRIIHITKPLLKDFDSENKIKIARVNFKRLSQKNKLISLENIFVEKFDALKAKELRYDFHRHERHRWNSAIKLRESLIASYFTNSATQEYFSSFIDVFRITKQILGGNNSGKEVVNILITSLRKIPNSRIEDYFPEFELVNESSNTYFAGKFNSLLGKQNKYRCYLHILSDIKSTNEYDKLLTDKIEEILNM